MKTSNKILLGTLLTVLLILTGIHVAMYAKYKSGDFTVSTASSNTDTVDIDPVNFVRITGMENIVIEPSSSFSMLKAKVMPANFKYLISGDTLVITGDTSSYKAGSERQFTRMSEQITLRLPAVEKISAENTSIWLNGTRDSASALNNRFDLAFSTLNLQQEFADSRRYFGNLDVTAIGNSRIEMNDYLITIKSLSCTLINSVLEDAPHSILEKISVNFDDYSVIKLNGTNLKKLQTTFSNKTSVTP
jgi:hypothetical protein